MREIIDDYMGYSLYEWLVFGIVCPLLLVASCLIAEAIAWWVVSNVSNA